MEKGSPQKPKWRTHEEELKQGVVAILIVLALRRLRQEDQSPRPGRGTWQNPVSKQKTQFKKKSQAAVAHACNPSYLEG
jgi:hypothetical protein